MPARLPAIAPGGGEGVGGGGEEVEREFPVGRGNDHLQCWRRDGACARCTRLGKGGRAVKFTIRLGEQPEETCSLLERNILMWAVVVQKITPRLSEEELIKQIAAIAFKGERAPEEWLSDPHLLAIGIRQIEKHLQCLKKVGFRTPKIEQAAKQFLAACKTADVKNLRNLLEHQAEYIAGEARKRHLVVDLKQSVSFGSDAPGMERSVWVSVFGKKCRVDPIVRAVAALEGALRE